MRSIILFFLCVVAYFYHVIKSTTRQYLKSTKGRILHRDKFNGSYCFDGIVSRRIGPERMHDYNVFWGDVLLFNFYPAQANNSQIVFNSAASPTEEITLLSSDSVDYEDPRVFPLQFTDNLCVLSYVSVSNQGTKRTSEHWACTIQKNLKLGTPVRLRLHDADMSVHKNWILLYASEDLRETHWSVFLQPQHQVYKVNLVSGEISFGWASTASVKAPLWLAIMQRANYGHLRGGSNHFVRDNKMWFYGHVKFPFRRISPVLYSVSMKPPYNIIDLKPPQRIAGGFECEYPMSVKHTSLLLGINNEAVVAVPIP